MSNNRPSRGELQSSKLRLQLKNKVGCKLCKALTSASDGMALEQSAIDVVMQTDPNIGIREGDTVILDVNGEKQAFLTVKRAGCVICCCISSLTRGFVLQFCVLQGFDSSHTVCSKVKVGKQLCSLEPIIGQPYGSVYQIAADTSELVRTKRYTGHCGYNSELCLDSWRISKA